MAADPLRDVESLVRQQDEWRARCINLIASENVLSRRARALLGSDFNHRYAEGHPGARYYQGQQYIDKIESAVSAELRSIFKVQQAEVRTISGTNANDVVFSSIVKAGDPVVVNGLPMGGHISHQLMGGLGKYTRNILNWPRTADGYRIDVPQAKDFLKAQKPKLVIFGKSLILFPEPVAELAPVAREVGAAVIYDGAHVLGLIAGGQFQDPLREGAEVMMGSTHKTFYGPQRGVVLGATTEERWKRIDKMAFPGSLSNHHLMTLPPLLMAALEFRAFGAGYATQVRKNAKRLAQALHGLGMGAECAELGFTESHQVSVDVKAFGGGGKAAVVLEENDIIVNRNLLPFDPAKQVLNPSGIRIGVQEMTRVGMNEPEMDEIARLIKESVADGKKVKSDVNAFRARFQAVKYSYDEAARTASSGVAAGAVDVDMAGY